MKEIHVCLFIKQYNTEYKVVTGGMELHNNPKAFGNSFEVSSKFLCVWLYMASCASMGHYPLVLCNKFASFLLGLIRRPSYSAGSSNLGPAPQSA